MASEEDVVDEAAAAATGYVFSHYRKSAVEDLDVRVSFDDEELVVDVYLDTDADTDAERERERQVADDAAIAATAVVDELMRTDQ